MKRIATLFAFVLALMLAAQALAGQIEIRQKDGSRWRGEMTDRVEVGFMLQGVVVSMQGKLTKVEDLYIVVDGTFAGQPAKKTVFKSDIVTMRTLDGSGAADEPAADVKAASGNAATGSNANEIGVFVLPMKGMVGEGFRHEEVEKLAKHCDQYGPGQIIVLEIESGGGLAIEMEIMHKTIVEVRKRHRVIAWIKEAISAAAATASNCNEIYFHSTGTLGAMTMFAGGVSAKGEDLQKWLNSAGNMFESGGGSRYIAEAMIDDEKLLSYDKNDETGEVTWHNDLSGEFPLSDAKTNLVFTAKQAMHCGFADGVADTGEELAKLLNLPKWNEKDDFGRKMSKDWLDTVDKAKEELPLLAARMQYKGAAEGGKAVINSRIQILKDVVRWWDRCPNVCFLSGVPPKEDLERQIEELKRILARMD